MKRQSKRASAKGTIEALGTNFLEFMFDLGALTDDAFQYVNLGGCGIYAAEVAHCLKELGFDEVDVVVLRPKNCDARATDLATLRPKVKDPCDMAQWRLNGIVLEHLLVRFRFNGKSYLIDTAGYQPETRRALALQKGSFSVEEAVQLSRQRYGGWNDTFDYWHRAYRLRRLIRGAFRRYLRDHGIVMTIPPTQRSRRLRVPRRRPSIELLHDYDILQVTRALKHVDTRDSEQVQNDFDLTPEEEAHVTACDRASGSCVGD